MFFSSFHPELFNTNPLHVSYSLIYSRDNKGRGLWRRILVQPQKISHLFVPSLFSVRGKCNSLTRGIFED